MHEKMKLALVSNEAPRLPKPIRREAAVIGWSVLLAATYLFSMYLIQPYIDGDQKHYRAFYSTIANVDIATAYRYQIAMLGSGEPLYTAVMWIGAQLSINKDTYISFMNVLLVAAMVTSLRRWRVPWLIVGLCLFNYYLLVLMTGAERLKFSYILLFIGLSVASRWRYLFLWAAPFAHFQTLMNLVSVTPPFLANAHIPLRHTPAKWVLILSAAAFGLVGFIYVAITLGPAVLDKFLIYSDPKKGPEILFQWIAISFLGIIITKRKIRFLSIMLPLGFFTFILGGERVNMISFVMFFYTVMTDRRAGHPLMYLLLGYFCVKSIGFIQNIMQNGHGFT